MDDNPIANRDPDELVATFNEIVGVRHMRQSTQDTLSGVLEDFLKIAADSGLLALPTVLTYGKHVAGWIFKLATPLATDTLSFAIRLAERRLGFAHLIGGSVETMAAQVIRQAGMYELTRPATMPLSPGRPVSREVVVPVYTRVLSLALQYQPGIELVPAEPGQIHWTKTTEPQLSDLH